MPQEKVRQEEASGARFWGTMYIDRSCILGTKYRIQAYDIQGTKVKQIRYSIIFKTKVNVLEILKKYKQRRGKETQNKASTFHGLEKQAMNNSYI